ncbi:MAG: Uma2 family endonuclease [Bacteroidetes bacterium]|nr:Uma2 family endonuclease [Bacteroidota bacterium]
MGLPIKKADHKFTYVEYSTWPDDERWELIDGTAYNMSPAPSTSHQRVSRILFSQICNFVENSSCEPFAAPFDVYLPEFPDQDFNEIDTIVQPDLIIICDSSKIIQKGCLGAPDMVVEILSPSTAKKDMNEKFQLYEKHGVKEYWVVDPGNAYIRVFHLQSEGIEAGMYDEGILIPPVDWRKESTFAESSVLDGFRVDTTELFKEF